MNITEKACTACGITKPITDFRFSKSSGMYYGHCYECFTTHKDEYVKAEPTVTIPVSAYNELIKAAEKLEAISGILG